MNFGQILALIELFIGRVPEKAQSIIMNMIIKIPEITDPNFKNVIKEVQLQNTYKNPKKKTMPN